MTNSWILCQRRCGMKVCAARLLCCKFSRKLLGALFGSVATVYEGCVVPAGEGRSEHEQVDDGHQCTDPQLIHQDVQRA